MQLVVVVLRVPERGGDGAQGRLHGDPAPLAVAVFQREVRADDAVVLVDAAWAPIDLPADAQAVDKAAVDRARARLRTGERAGEEVQEDREEEPRRRHRAGHCATWVESRAEGTGNPPNQKLLALRRVGRRNWTCPFLFRQVDCGDSPLRGVSSQPAMYSQLEPPQVLSPSGLNRKGLSPNGYG